MDNKHAGRGLAYHHEPKVEEDDGQDGAKRAAERGQPRHDDAVVEEEHDPHDDAGDQGAAPRNLDPDVVVQVEKADGNLGGRQRLREFRSLKRN